MIFYEPPETMDIYAKPGTKITFEYPENGYEFEMKWASSVLTVGETYTVKTISVGQSVSYVTLEEFPEIEFNTVHFAKTKKEIG